jgi:8-oxo-dGTP diphosphatase
MSKIKKIQPVVLAFIKKDNTYLLTLRNDNASSPFNKKWQIPGGGLEFGESAEEAVIREAHEELGVEIEIVKMVPKVLHKLHGDAWHGLFLSFLCIMKNENAEIILNEEATEHSWFTYEEILQLDALPSIDKLITEAHKASISSTF